MAKLKMQKIEIIGFLADSKKILERLQRRGAVEITDINDENLIKINTQTSISNFEKNLSTAKSALECLLKYSPQKSYLFDGLNGRRTITTDEFAKRKSNNSQILHICHDILKNSRTIASLKNEQIKNSIKAEQLKQWIKLDIPLSFSGTKSTVCFTGSITGSKTYNEVLDLIKNVSPDISPYIEIINARKEKTDIFVMCHISEKDKMTKALADINFVYSQLSGSSTASDIIKNINDENDKLNKNIEFWENKIRSYASNIDDIKFFIDFLIMRTDKYKAIEKMALTQNTVIITGYVPQIYAELLIKEFEEKYTVAITITVPGADDEVPVALKNSKFSEPVESVTEMYAMPNKRDVDPTSVMSFFYYLFFGMMLSDAGYGVLMIIGTSLCLKKFNLEKKTRNFIKMFQYCGISTLIWGALFGSWFGDLPQIIASNFLGKTIKTTALWFEPLNNPIKLLLFSFLLGILHLFLGLAVNFRIIWKEGRKFDAVCEVLPIYITIIGVAPVAASILTHIPQMYITAGKYMLVAGVILIVLTSGRSGKNIFMRFFGGIYGLYNIATGYLGDILSYSRLLALGLATGSIASVINLIATMPSNVYVKAVMLIVVGIAGHILNLGINVLGAYVHSDRLQFVELFSKFYEGGGKPFKPLNINTNYYKFEKENIYE